MEVPLGCGGSTKSGRGKGGDASSRRTRSSFAGAFLLADDAQRSGRAGRSGQAALVVAYCAAQGPHDQYYFGRPEAMVSGIVRPPALELANRDLVRAHLHAIWLAESGKELATDIPHVLDLTIEALPVQEEVAHAFAAPDLKLRAAAAMGRVLDSIAA